MTAVVLAAAVPAQAQTACASHAEVLNHLADNFAEAPVAMGLASNGGVIEVLSSADGSTWTILITMPNGQSCMVAAGESWLTVPTKSTKTGFQT